jgi:hypothetical protein
MRMCKSQSIKELPNWAWRDSIDSSPSAEELVGESANERNLGALGHAER